MKPKTRHRLMIACLGAALSVCAAFVSAGLTGWAFHVHRYGMRAPEMFGWFGAFILFGLIALIAVAPALVAIHACGVVWRTPLGRHAILSILLPFILGGLAIALCILTNPKDIALSGFIVAGVTCLAIVGIVEFVTKETLQNKQLEHYD